MNTGQFESLDKTISRLPKHGFPFVRFVYFMTAILVGSLLSACSCIPSKQPMTPGSASSAPASRPSDAPTVSDIIKSVQVAIDPFYQTTDAPSSLPPLKSVKLSLQTVQDDKISIEADYLLVALKGYNDNAHTQELDVILTPEEPKLTTKSFKEPPSIADILQQAIRSAQNQVQRTYTSTFPGHSLNTSEVDVQISFAVTWDGAAGVNKWELSPISLSGSDEISYKTTHTITVVFAKPDK